LEWMVKHKIHEIGEVGKVMASYYMEPGEILKCVSKDKKPDFVTEKEKKGVQRVKLEKAELRELEEHVQKERERKEMEVKAAIKAAGEEMQEGDGKKSLFGFLKRGKRMEPGKKGRGTVAAKGVESDDLA